MRTPKELQQHMQQLLAKARNTPGGVNERSTALIDDMRGLDLADARVMALMGICTLAEASDQIEDMRRETHALADELRAAGVIA